MEADEELEFIVTMSAYSINNNNSSNGGSTNDNESLDLSLPVINLLNKKRLPKESLFVAVSDEEYVTSEEELFDLLAKVLEPIPSADGNASPQNEHTAVNNAFKGDMWLTINVTQKNPQTNKFIRSSLCILLVHSESMDTFEQSIHDISELCATPAGEDHPQLLSLATAHEGKDTLLLRQVIQERISRHHYRTLVMANVSPHVNAVTETQRTLDLCTRIKSIHPSRLPSSSMPTSSMSIPSGAHHTQADHAPEEPPSQAITMKYTDQLLVQERLNEAMAAYKQEIKEKEILLAELEKLSDANKAFRKMKDRQDEQLLLIKEALQSLNDACNQMRNYYKDTILKSQALILQDAGNELKMRVELIQKSFQTEETKLQALEAELKKRDLEVTLLKDTVNESEARREKAEAAKRQAEEELEAERKKKEAAIEEAKRLSSNSNNIGDMITRAEHEQILKQTTQALATDVAEKARVIELFKASMKKLNEEKASMKKQMYDLNKRKMDLEEQQQHQSSPPSSPTLESANNSRVVSTLKNRLKELEAENTTFSKKLEEINREKAAMEAEMNGLRDQLSRYRFTDDDLAKKLAEATELHNEEVAKIQAASEALKKHIEKLGEEKRELKKKIYDGNKRNADLESQLRALSDPKIQQQRRQQIDELESRIATLTQQIEEEREKQKSAVDREAFTSLQHRNAVLLAQLEDERNHVAKLTARTEELKASLAKVAEDHEAEKQAAAAASRGEIEKLEAEIARLQNTQSAADAIIRDLEQRQQHMQEERDAVATECAKLNEQMNAFIQQLDMQREQIQQLEANLAESKMEKLELDQLNASLVSRLEASQSVMARLAGELEELRVQTDAQQQQDADTIATLSAKSGELESALNELANKYQCEKHDMEHEFEARIASLTQVKDMQIAELQAELLARTDQYESRLNQLEEENKQIRSALATKEAELDSVKAQHVALLSEMSQLRASHDAKLVENESVINELRDKLSAQNVDIQLWKEKVETLEQQTNALERANTEISAKYNVAHTQLEQLKQEFAGKDAINNEYLAAEVAAHQATKQQLAAVTEELEALKQDVATNLKPQLQKLENIKRALSVKLKESEAHTMELQNNFEQSESKLKELKEVIASLKASFEQEREQAKRDMEAAIEQERQRAKLAIDQAVEQALDQERQQTKQLIEDAKKAADAYIQEERSSMHDVVEEAVAQALAHEREHAMQVLEDAVQAERASLQEQLQSQRERLEQESKAELNNKLKRCAAEYQEIISKYKFELEEHALLIESMKDETRHKDAELADLKEKYAAALKEEAAAREAGDIVIADLKRQIEALTKRDEEQTALILELKARCEEQQANIHQEQQQLQRAREEAEAAAAQKQQAPAEEQEKQQRILLLKQQLEQQHQLQQQQQQQQQQNSGVEVGSGEVDEDESMIIQPPVDKSDFLEPDIASQQFLDPEDALRDENAKLRAAIDKIVKDYIQRLVVGMERERNLKDQYKNLVAKRERECNILKTALLKKDQLLQQALLRLTEYSDFRHDQTEVIEKELAEITTLFRAAQQQQQHRASLNTTTTTNNATTTTTTTTTSTTTSAGPLTVSSIGKSNNRLR